jgi:IS30 family transposase
MSRRGRKRQLEIESEYWRLLACGVGTVDACRTVGIGRKTGYRWRAENGGVPPVRLPEAARATRYLSLLERHRIAALKARGHGVCDIAEQLGRSPSTISRELRRNMLVHDRGRYDGDLAHSRARQRTVRVRRSRLSRDEGLRAVVQAKLELEWSPQQIAGYLRAAFPDRPSWHLCHETIYQGVYNPGPGGLSRTLTRRLRTGRPLCKRRRRATARMVRFLAPSQLIHHRPAVVEGRTRLGDWEGDLIVGKLSQSAIGTLVDRRSGYTRLIHLPDGHTADQLHQAILPVLASLRASTRMTLTWDQGSEMAHHDKFSEHFTDGVYFALPASPWQRGTNENTNGLLRQYFPKGRDLRIYSPQDLHDVEERLNHRPRKRHGWRTPAQLFDAALAR